MKNKEKKFRYIYKDQKGKLYIEIYTLEDIERGDVENALMGFEHDRLKVEIISKDGHTGHNDKNGNCVFGKDIIKVEVCGVPSGNEPEEELLREIIGEDGAKSIAKKEEFYNGLWKVEDHGYAFVLRSLEDKKIGKNTFDAQTVIGDLGKLSEIEIEIIGNEFENPELLK